MLAMPTFQVVEKGSERPFCWVLRFLFIGTGLRKVVVEIRDRHRGSLKGIRSTRKIPRWEGRQSVLWVAVRRQSRQLQALCVFAFLMAPTLFSSTTSPRGSLEKKAVAAPRAAELELVAKPSPMEEEAVEPYTHRLCLNKVFAFLHDFVDLACISNINVRSERAGNIMCHTWLTVQHSTGGKKTFSSVVAKYIYIKLIYKIFTNASFFIFFIALMTTVFFIIYSTYKILCSNCFYAQKYNFCISVSFSLSSITL